MTTKYTPGPWHLSVFRNYAVISGVVMSNLARVSIKTREGRANALLMTKAPRMATAIEELHQTIVSAALCPFGVALVRDTCDCNYHAAAKSARALLAEIEGDK